MCGNRTLHPIGIMEPQHLAAQRNEHPYTARHEKLTVELTVTKEISDWIRENNIAVDHLLQKLIHDFYSSHKMIEE